jgi:hypothetical protein
MAQDLGWLNPRNQRLGWQAGGLRSLLNQSSLLNQRNCAGAWFTVVLRRRR